MSGAAVLRLAILGFWHVHAMDHVREAQRHPDTEIVVAWDDDPHRGHAAAEAIGVDWAERLDDVLARADLDGIVVDTATSRHRDVIVAAARAGKHVFTEKVLAASTSGVDEILAEVERAGIVLTVSLTRLAEPYARGIADLVAGGAVGTVTSSRVRVAHSGALNGFLPDHFFLPAEALGGALLDLGAHPIYLSRLLHGRLPEAVMAQIGHITTRPLEDNASVLFSYSDGALGVAEVGLVASSFTGVEVHGTEASLVYNSTHGRLLSRGTGRTDTWREHPLPPPLPSPFSQWVDSVRSGSSDRSNLLAAADLTRVLEAAYRSAEWRCEVSTRTMEPTYPIPTTQRSRSSRGG
jgi:1,5-anhydro-D-fructose reductase (1,5-anhydro-D-mannitol-forming)